MHLFAEEVSYERLPEQPDPAYPGWETDDQLVNNHKSVAIRLIHAIGRIDVKVDG